MDIFTMVLNTSDIPDGFQTDHCGLPKSSADINDD